MIVNKKTGRCTGSCKESPSLSGGGRIVIHHHKGTCHHIGLELCGWCSIRTKILVAFLDEDDGSYDDETVYFYRAFEERTKLPRHQLEIAMHELRDVGLAVWVKGLVSDSGNGYYGSGFMLTSHGVMAARAIYAVGKPKNS